MSNVTYILNAIEKGDAHAVDQLLPLIYDELRILAAQKLAHEPPNQTLQSTALVHEAYLRLLGTENPSWNGRGHFFAAAAEAMRRILIENARRKQRIKHGRNHQRVELDDAEIPVEQPSEDILALNEALEKLSLEDPDKAELVKLRYFAGLTIQQSAVILKISRATAERYWSYARAWLFHEIRKGE